MPHCSRRAAALTRALAIGVALTATLPAVAEATTPPQPIGDDISLPESIGDGGSRAGRLLGPAPLSSPAYAGAGFLTFSSPYDYSELRTRPSYTLRLVANANGNVELVRAAAEFAAASVGSASGTAITVAPGTVPDTTPDREPVAGEILLSLDTTSGCDGDRWAGCGGPRLYSYRVADRATVVNAGRIWLKPDTPAYSTHNLRHLVSHELGHALGLDHHADLFGGQEQVMHPLSYAAETYRSGDANGLTFLAQQPPAATTRSFNGDGRADLVVASPGTNQYAVALSDGSRLNGAGWWLSGWNGRPDFADVGDFNGDGKGDLVVGSQATSTYSVAISTGADFNGPGTQQWLRGAAVGAWAKAGDFNGDGKSDLVIADPVNHTYSVALSYGSGFYTPSTWLTGWNGRPDFADVGDFNGDGKDDLIVGSQSNATYSVAISTGSDFTGAGTQQWLTGWGVGVWARAGDVNGDGKADLVVASPGTNQYAAALSDGSRLNGAGWWLSGWNGRPDFADLGDFNGDGKQDLVVGSQATTAYSVAISTGADFNGPGTQQWLVGWGVGVWAAAG